LHSVGGLCKEIECTDVQKKSERPKHFAVTNTELHTVKFKKNEYTKQHPF